MSNQVPDGVNPADTVKVPPWVKHVEESLHLRSRYLHDTIILTRFCREYRELLVIIADLKEDKGELYFVLLTNDYTDTTNHCPGIFHSLLEAEIYAHEASMMSDHDYETASACLYISPTENKIVTRYYRGIEFTPENDPRCETCLGSGETNFNLVCGKCRGRGTKS